MEMSVHSYCGFTIPFVLMNNKMSASRFIFSSFYRIFFSHRILCSGFILIPKSEPISSIGQTGIRFSPFFSLRFRCRRQRLLVISTVIGVVAGGGVRLVGG